MSCGDSLGRPLARLLRLALPDPRRLEHDGAIESEAGDERGARRKKVYRITPKGEQVFLELLQETPNDTQGEDARFRMRLAFFRYLPPETRSACWNDAARRCRTDSRRSRSRCAPVAGAPTTTVAR